MKHTSNPSASRLSSVNGAARHTVRFVCVLKTAPQFTAIRPCVWSGAPGALCVCSHPAVKLLSTHFLLLSALVGLAPSTIHYPRLPHRATPTTSLHHLLAGQPEVREWVFFLCIVRFLAVPRGLLVPCSAAEKNRESGSKLFFDSWLHFAGELDSSDLR